MKSIFVSHEKEKSTTSERIIDPNVYTTVLERDLFSVESTRELEAWANSTLPTHTLMRRAGLAVARLALALAPHARVFWIACGPGNNGGDGYEAAMHLKLWGKSPIVTICHSTDDQPADASESFHRAVQAGVTLARQIPTEYDFCIDALFGIGTLRALGETYTGWIHQMNSRVAPVLSVDVPTGLNAQTGAAQQPCVHANTTISFLTLKPGLFTGDGREACGDIWFDDLSIHPPTGCVAKLNAYPAFAARAHNTNKGSFGDVGVIGGASGMSGAAILAARASLHGGAGRVYLALLDRSTTGIDNIEPALMFRKWTELAIESMTIVAGCGGGAEIAELLPAILERSERLVLDADALNAVARDAALQRQLSARDPQTTVLTPHPLEAARLMGSSCTDVQLNRLAAAQVLANRYQSTVVLKGSGTVIAAPGVLPQINPTGNARLATAGTGDTLAGLIGSRIAAGGNLFQCTCESVFRHGLAADRWPNAFAMTASDLIGQI
jgi:hydroxyethylthiazole kinase-like uncharacterized protein yjeF